jgi:mannitol/fructose-specific phosphotransferase system IIA component (Ntr-type)
LAAIRELATAVAQHSGVEASEIERVAWAREQTVATGIGHGVAIPHARRAELKEPIVAVGISEAGVDFDAPDGQPTHVVFLLVTPRADPAVQLDLSADISRLFRQPNCLECVLRARSFTEFLAAIKTAAPQ